MHRITPFFFRYGAYWLILLAGIGYLYFHTNRETRLQSMASHSIRLVTPLADARNRELLTAVVANAVAYRNEHNDKYSRHAQTAAQLLERFLRHIEAGRAPRLRAATGELQMLADTLVRLCDHDRGVQNEMDRLRAPVRECPAPVFDGADPEWRLNVLACEARLLTGIALSYLYQRTSGSGGHFIDPFMPVWAARKVFPRAGEPYEADIFLATYHQPFKPEILIDGQIWPDTDGWVRYRRVYDTAGKHLLNVRILSQDTAGQKRLLSESDFEISIHSK